MSGELTSVAIPSKPRARALRLRPALYAVLVALAPTAAAAWAIGTTAADHARSRADAVLAAEVQRAARVAEARLAAAQLRAGRLARTPSVQRALVGRDRAALSRIAARNPNTSLRSGAVTIGARPSTAVASRTAAVSIGGEASAGVTVSLPRSEMLARIRTTARAEADRVLLVRRGRVPRSPGNTEIAGRDVRGVSLPISSRYDVAAVRPVSTIDRASRDAWLLVVGAALVTLATIGLIAAAAAPLLARGRFAYRERTQALRVLSHVEDGVVLTEAGVVQLWNRAAERITGLRRDDVLGKPLTAVPGLESIEGRIPVGREGAIRPETLPVEVGGDELWLSIVGVEVAGGVVYTFGDVTDEQRLEELKTDFISTVSHEMRTPLAGIYGAAVTLRERGVVLPPQLRDEFLETIRKQSERLAELVEDVLLVDRLDARGVALGEEPFDAVALAGDVVAEARLRGASVELVAPRSVDVVADSGRTRQVLTNLLDNAVKYGGDGRIVVTVGAADAFVRFGVRDEGPGIPRDEHERIFEKFHRFDPQMEYGVGGSGLGLYICRELVVRMNGRIWVESAPGEGATFAFELPRAEGAAVQ